MTWLGSANHCGLLYAAIVMCARLALGPWAARPHYHLVSHRKLRAASPERAGTRTTAWQPSRAFWYHAWLAERRDLQLHLRGSADADSVETQPAPGPPATLPGAGLERRTVDEPLLEDGPAEGPQLPPTAAGPERRATTAHTVQAHPTDGCGGPAQRPVDVTHPDDVTSTGVQPRNSGEFQGCEPSASDPSPGALVRGAA